MYPGEQENQLQSSIMHHVLWLPAVSFAHSLLSLNPTDTQQAAADHVSLHWHSPASPASLAEGRGVAGWRPGRVQGALPRRWPSQAGSIEEGEGIQQPECPFVSEQCARLALMRQLFVAGLSTSSGLVDSLTWLLQIKQAGTRDAYDSTLKAPAESPSPPPPSSLLPLPLSLRSPRLPGAPLIGGNQPLAYFRCPK